MVVYVVVYPWNVVFLVLFWRRLGDLVTQLPSGLFEKDYKKLNHVIHDAPSDGHQTHMSDQVQFPGLSDGELQLLCISFYIKLFLPYVFK